MLFFVLKNEPFLPIYNFFSDSFLDGKNPRGRC